jgi:hypothetical protein
MIPLCKIESQPTPATIKRGDVICWHSTCFQGLKSDSPRMLARPYQETMEAFVTDEDRALSRDDFLKGHWLSWMVLQRPCQLGERSLWQW